MRDVLPELMKWWEAGDTIGVGTVVATFQSAPRPPGASMLVGPDETAVGSVSGGCVEGAVYDLAQSVIESGKPVLQRYGVSDDDAFAVGLTCGGILDVYVEKVSQETFPELGEIAADIEAGRPVALATVIEHPDPVWLGRRLVVRPGRRRRAGVGSARLAAGRRRGARRRDGAAGGRAQRHADLRPRRRASRRGDAGLRLGVRAQAAAAGLRRHRLRGRGGAGRRVPRLPRHRLRRPAGVRDEQPVPGGRRRGRRLAAPLPGRRARGRADRPAHRGHGPDPRPEVRRTPARGRAADARGGVRRRDGLAAYPRRPARAAPRGRADRRGAGPAVQPDRSRPGRPDARGDRDQHRGRDHRRPLGRQRRSGSASPTAGSTARRTRWADHPYTRYAPCRRHPRRAGAGVRLHQ